MSIKKIPNNTPYLSNRWDRIDEYHTLHSKEVTEEEFAQWWAVVFKKGKIKTLEDALRFQKYSLCYITKSNESSFYGSWQIDLYGGFFGCMGMYLSNDFYMPWIPKNILNRRDKNVLKDRFEYIINLIKKYYDV